jgi:Lon protease-like protein
MFELPLFPLNTVLFPGTPINLHIFEDRYKEMIDHCLTTNQPFGVVLIRQGMEALGPLANPYPIGCTAQITQMEPSEDGQMNILAVGLERFQIHSLNYDQSYLVGEVETFPLDSPNPLSVVQAGRQLRPWVERYLTVLANAAENIEFKAEQLPNDPLALGYLAAALVQIPTAQKQVLLATQDATDLLTDIRTIYRREVALMNAIIEHDVAEPEGLFSVN